VQRQRSVLGQLRRPAAAPAHRPASQRAPNGRRRCIASASGCWAAPAPTHPCQALCFLEVKIAQRTHRPVGAGKERRGGGGIAERQLTSLKTGGLAFEARAAPLHGARQKPQAPWDTAAAPWEALLPDTHPTLPPTLAPVPAHDSRLLVLQDLGLVRLIHVLPERLPNLVLQDLFVALLRGGTREGEGACALRSEGSLRAMCGSRGARHGRSRSSRGPVPHAPCVRHTAPG
jgi:hypothetical protein